MAHVILDGYRVIATTPDAVGIAKADLPRGANPIWLPRSLCEDGDSLERDDTDIQLAAWKADELGLDH